MAPLLACAEPLVAYPRIAVVVRSAYHPVAPACCGNLRQLALFLYTFSSLAGQTCAMRVHVASNPQAPPIVIEDGGSAVIACTAGISPVELGVIAETRRALCVIRAHHSLATVHTYLLD